jgi:hypothetical protein
MANAKMVNGKALVGYVNGVGVDSEGVAIEGAPKQPKQTPSEQQPGAQGAPSPEERMAIAIAQAITNPKELAARGAKPSAARDSGEESEEVGGAPVADRTTVREADQAPPPAAKRGRRAKKS